MPNPSKEPVLKIVRLGQMDYGTGVRLQETLLSLRQERRIDDLLLLLEHPSVITIGKSQDRSHIRVSPRQLREAGVAIHQTNRGGNVTYHGPGQIVGYPILHLDNYGRDIRQFIRRVEEVFITLLAAAFAIQARRDPAYTGVWVGNQKIVAIGFAIKRWVTMHGFALNVNTDLDHFQWIHSCGITDPNRSVTSLQQLLGKPIDEGYCMDCISSYFPRTFGVTAEPISEGGLYQHIACTKSTTTKA